MKEKKGIHVIVKEGRDDSRARRDTHTNRHTHRQTYTRKYINTNANIHTHTHTHAHTLTMLLLNHGIDISSGVLVTDCLQHPL